MRHTTPLLLAALIVSPVAYAESKLPAAIGDTFAAADSIDCSGESSADAAECLAGLQWTPEKFEVHIEPARAKHGDLLVRFPSPRLSGNAQNDLVSMEWYIARDDDGNPIKAPAMVVVHESGSSMPAGRMIANGLRSAGVHALMIHLPYYGERRPPGLELDGELFISATGQGIADVRRAYDVVSVLPLIDTDRIGLQGTSLGGFVSATVGGLDDAYDAVFLMLAGGDLFDVIQNGAKDAAEYRETLAEAGFTDERLKTELRKVEPNRIAHRLNPETTWLYSGLFDQVVPIKNARSLATAIGLDKSHHIEMVANHYTGVVYIPFVLEQMSRELKNLP